MNLGSLDAGVYFVVGLNKNNQIISAKKIIKK
jgi:hypothetical protein